VSQENYAPKHFARSVLLILDAARWNIDWTIAPFTTMPFSTILKWTPDENNHCRPLAEVFVPEVFRRFAMNPLLVSAWACLGGFLSEEDFATLRRTPERQFLRPLEAFEAGSNGVVPSMATFLETARNFAGAVSAEPAP